MNPESILNITSEKLSSGLESVLEQLPDQIPVSIQLSNTLLGMLIFMAGALVAGILFRLLFGKRSSVNRAMSSALGILFIYAVTTILYTCKLDFIRSSLPPLPFAVLHKEILFILPFEGTPATILCKEILPLVILSFLVNFADSLIPDGRSVASWIITQILTVVLAIILNAAASYYLKLYLPEVFAEYAPAAVLIILIAFLVLGVFKWLTSLVLIAVNPILGGIYTFFFSTFIGKQITKAVLTTVLICVLFYFLESSGYTILAISPEALLSYIPVASALMLLWFIIGYKL